MSPASQLFESKVSLSGREYDLAVIPIGGSNQSKFYRCILDKIKTIEVRKTDDGNWIDMNGGSSQLSGAIGKVIESNMRYV